MIRRHKKSNKCRTSAKCCKPFKSVNRLLRIETMEPRQMLAADGFLQGVAFVDGDGDMLLDASEVRKVGATINLYKDSDGGGFSAAELATPVATTLTGADGSYIFEDLGPGTYQIEEVAPVGFTTIGTQILSQLNPAMGLANNRIQVEVIDPASVEIDFDFGDLVALGRFKDISLTFFDTPASTAAGLFPVSIDRPLPFGPAEFLTLCVNPFENLSGGENLFAAIPEPLPSGDPLPGNWERISYLFNHYVTSMYGEAQPLSAVDAAAMQLAIWELMYDSGNDVDPFASGNIKDVTYFGGGDATEVVDRAEFYVLDSAGKDELSTYLRAIAPPILGGLQSMICTGSYNFVNAPATGKITGKKYKETIVCECDKYGNETTSVVTSTMSGVTIKLYRDLDSDGVLDDNEDDVALATTVTGSTGSYSFTGLAPGKYFVQEVVGSGYAPVTPATVSVTLAAGQTVSSGNNFTNRLVKASIGNYFFIDSNSNGIQDLGDFGVNGVTVKLLNSAGSVIETTTTADDGAGNNGYYLFYNLDAGQYRIEFDVPTGVVFTTKGAGSNAALDSDVYSSGRTDLITLAANTHRRDIDAGVLPEVCIDTITYKVKDYFDACQEAKAGVIKGITVEYNEQLDELFVQVTIGSYNGRIADGFTIVIGEGEGLNSVKAGSYAVFYFDATGSTPVLNVLGYNGDDDGTSFKDANASAYGTQTPIKIATSKNNSSGWVKQLTTATVNGRKVMTFSIDAGVVNDVVPLKSYNWQGAEIGNYASFKVDTFDGLTTAYDSAGFLTKWSFCYHGWADACQIKTTKCIVKECIDIDEFFAKWGWSTSAFTGNSNGDPLRDIFWDGSEALCKCDDTCGDKYGCDYDRDCDNDWGYKDSCFGSYSWSSWRC